MTTPFHVWDPGDSSYMKMIYARRADGTGFRVLASRFHPIGDFDSPGSSLPPGEPARIYKTSKGFRVFFTGRHGEPPGGFLESLIPHGLDPLYAKICRDRGYYAVRVDPKVPDPTGGSGAVATLLAQSGRILPEWGELISNHDGMCGVFSDPAILV